MQEPGHTTIDFKSSNNNPTADQPIISMSRENYDRYSGLLTKSTTLTCPTDNQAHYLGKCRVDQRAELVKKKFTSTA